MSKKTKKWKPTSLIIKPQVIIEVGVTDVEIPLAVGGNAEEGHGICRCFYAPKQEIARSGRYHCLEAEPEHEQLGCLCRYIWKRTEQKGCDIAHENVTSSKGHPSIYSMNPSIV